MKDTCPLLLLLVLAAPLCAQQNTARDNEPVWYAVEVLIFRYLDTSAETESWPERPELSYPPELRHLRPGLPYSDLLQEYRLQRVEDSVPGSAFDLAWKISTQQLQRDADAALRAMAAEPPPPGLPAAVDGTDTTIPRAFVPLAEDAAEFRAQALRIRRSADKRVLFHQSWLQPLRGRDASLSVPVEGVIEEGDYPALQGSLLLYVSRYLHVETNIWLNIHGEAAGAGASPGGANDPGPENDALDSWRMPPPPLPPSAYSWTPWTFQVRLEPGFSDDIVLAPVWRGVPEPGGGQPDLAAAVEPISAVLDPADILQPIVITARRIGVPDLAQMLAQKWYPFQRAVRVAQERRMRGGEVHYLDHPLLGIILRVSPYEFEPFIPPARNGQLAANPPGFPQ